MSFPIKVRAIRDAHQLFPLTLFIFTLWEKAILNIDGTFGVVREFSLRLFIQSQIRAGDSNRLKPLIAAIDPFLMRGFVFAGFDEVFQLHLFELARAKDEIAGRDLVAKRLADLRHAERQFAPAGIQHVEKVYEDSL